MYTYVVVHYTFFCICIDALNTCTCTDKRTCTCTFTDKQRTLYMYTYMCNYMYGKFMYMLKNFSTILQS